MRANIGKALTVIVGNVVKGANTEMSYRLHYELSPSVIFTCGRGLALGLAEKQVRQRLAC